MNGKQSESRNTTNNVGHEQRGKMRAPSRGDVGPPAVAIVILGKGCGSSLGGGLWPQPFPLLGIAHPERAGGGPC